MIPVPLEQIDHAALRSLLGSKLESKTFEVKRELALDKPGREKLLKGVVALANTQGGDFVIGITEKDGVLIAADGAVPTAALEDYRLDLKNQLRDNIEPSLIGIDIHPVDCGTGKWAILLRVPRSWAGPHRSKLDGHFYYRTSASSERMDVADLRRAFGIAENAFERIEAFRRDRLLKIMAGETPARLSTGPSLILHTAPLPAFANRDPLDVVAMVAAGHHMPMPFRGGGVGTTVNLAGICNVAGQHGNGVAGYGQLFRDLAYERISVCGQDGATFYVAGPDLAKTLVEAFRTTISLYAAYGIAFPLYAMFSFAHAEQLHLRVAAHGGGFHDLPPRNGAVVAYPEVMIENAGADVHDLARPLLDMVWNSYGELRCPYYDQEGRWTLG